jgi:hypothetical protein
MPDIDFKTAVPAFRTTGEKKFAALRLLFYFCSRLWKKRRLRVIAFGNEPAQYTP